MKTAIIGSGISGLGAAYLLHPKHDICVYEQNGYSGGHSRTVDVQKSGKSVPVDTGFIVFNKRNYPLLTALFDRLDVPYAKSSMSFGISINDGFLEYGTENLRHLFAQKQNLLRPAFWGMLFDILRFNRKATRLLLEDSNLTMGEYLAQLKSGDWFKNYYLLAMGGAIWSTPVKEMLDFPAKSFIRFFHNHGLLTVNNQPQWYSVTGGSREYITRLTADFQDKILTGTGVKKVTRSKSQVTIHDTNGNSREFDRVIFACHADEALQLLETPTPQEREIIGSFQYQNNKIVLHSDISFMPQNRKCWSSWVYLSNTQHDRGNKIGLSYWMNNLQQLETDEPLIVTMNPQTMPEQDKIYDIHEFTHPVFNTKAIAAQNHIHDIQGQNSTWYCGAYQRYGFHEDGLWSAYRVAEQMGIKLP